MSTHGNLLLKHQRRFEIRAEHWRPRKAWLPAASLAFSGAPSEISALVEKRGAPNRPLLHDAAAVAIGDGDHAHTMQCRRHRSCSSVGHMAIYDFEEEEVTNTLPRRILIAEDDATMRGMVAHWLRRDGYEVVEAGDGRELLEQIAIAVDRGSLDLVISDVRMPGVDGIEALQCLRSIGNRTPVLLMSAFGDQQLQELASAAGAAGFIAKPFEMSDICTAVRYWAYQGVCA